MNVPLIIGVGGLSSNVGKTTLMCQLLERFPGWEAIKTTRGHYRSCGKDPHSCCVSHLLADEPVIRSGRAETYTVGKDTGRYWDAGASNVHWLIATEEQIESGIKKTLKRVIAPGVFVEGNSCSKFVAVGAMIMVASTSSGSIKSSAIRSLHKASALYIGEAVTPHGAEVVFDLINDSGLKQRVAKLPRYTQNTFLDLISTLTALQRPVPA
jgi:molybdopterin-guanine dinucleotide biosynthesis protein